MTLREFYDAMLNNIEFEKIKTENGYPKYRELLMKNELKDMKYKEGFYPIISVYYYYKYESVAAELSIVMNNGSEYIICNGEDIKNMSALYLSFDDFKSNIIDCCANMAAEVKCHNYDNEIIDVLNYDDTL